MVKVRPLWVHYTLYFGITVLYCTCVLVVLVSLGYCLGSNCTFVFILCLSLNLTQNIFTNSDSLTIIVLVVCQFITLIFLPTVTHSVGHTFI